jgi:hypothetical protein
MIGALHPQWVFSIQAGFGICGEYPAYIRRVRPVEVVKRVTVPGDIENANHAAMVLFDGPHDQGGRQDTTQRVPADPRIRKQVAVVRHFSRRCVLGQSQQSENGDDQNGYFLPRKQGELLFSLDTSYGCGRAELLLAPTCTE